MFRLLGWFSLVGSSRGGYGRAKQLIPFVGSIIEERIRSFFSPVQRRSPMTLYCIDRQSVTMNCGYVLMTTAYKHM